MIRCCHKDQCNVTCHCERFSAYPAKKVFLIGVQKLATMLPECLSSQTVFAMTCDTGTVFIKTSLQIVSLKIVQCHITFICIEYIAKNAGWV